MAFSLESAARTKHAKPPRMVVHGGEGAGKSTFLSECPNSIFIQTEDGLNGIDAIGLPLCKKFNEVIEQIDALITQEHEYKAVWIDSADWLETLMHEHICQEQKVSSIEKASGGYGKGYLEALNLWRKILNGLDVLNNKGMFVGLTCHSRIQEMNDPEYEHSYDSFRLKLHSPKSGKGSLELLSEWADVIGFCKVSYKVGDMEVAKSDVKKMKNVTRHRILCLDPTVAYVAKNRYRLPSEISLELGSGWKAFIEALTQNQ